MLQKSLIAAVLSTPARVRKSAPSHLPLSPRILVVDDDADLRGLCAEALTAFGYLVNTAGDGEEAWKILDAAGHGPDSYDLMITDYNMPRVTGIELVKKMRSARMDLPVILVSGSDRLNTEHFHLAESLQLASILPKPFSVEQLVQTVRAVLRAAKKPPGSA